MPLNNDDIKQLIAILQKGLVADDSIDKEIEVNNEEDVTDDKGIYSSSSRKRQKNKVAKSSDINYNKFDAMPEKTMHKDDIQIDRALSKYAPTSRSREFNLINVVCRVCGKKDEINPSLVYDSGSRYKCNKCSTTPG